MKMLVRLTVCLNVLLALSGCWAHSETRSRTNSLGQELIDLKRALEDGAISKDEYDTAREGLIESASE